MFLFLYNDVEMGVYIDIIRYINVGNIMWVLYLGIGGPFHIGLPIHHNTHVHEYTGTP